MTTEAPSERWIRQVRPTTSESGPAMSNPAPMPNIASDTLRVEAPVETSKSRRRSGSSACVEYSRVKVASPAAKSDQTIRR